MNKKELVGDVFNQLRLMRQRWQESGPEGAPARPFQRADVSRLQNGHGEAGNGHTTTPQLPIGDAQHAMTRQGIDSTMAQLLMIMETLDTYIGEPWSCTTISITPSSPLFGPSWPALVEHARASDLLMAQL